MSKACLYPSRAPRHISSSGSVAATMCLILSLCSARVSGQEAGEHTLRLRLDQDFVYNDVTGPGSAQSSLTEGGNYLTEVGVTARGGLDGLDYLFDTSAKLTDDTAIDPRRLSLVNLRARIKNDKFALNLGDTFESFSQYSLSTSMKGGSLRLAPGAEWMPEIRVIGGVAYPRWDNFLGDEEVDAIKRMGHGLRLSKQFGETVTLGVNAVATSDDDEVNSTDTLYDSRVYSVDAEWSPIEGLTVSAESAYSDTEEFPGADRASDYRDGAHRVKAVASGGPSRVTLEYERVSPEFYTGLGSASADREKAKFKWRYKMNRRVTTRLGFLWYRDNLDGQKDTRTNHYKPSVDVTVKKLFGRRFAALDLGYRFDRSYSQTRSTLDHIVTTGYRDRLGPIDLDTTVSFTSYDTKDSQLADEIATNVILSSRHKVGMWTLRPSLNVTSWNSRDELQDRGDQIYEQSVGLRADVPKWKLNTSVKIGQNRLAKDVGTDSTRQFARVSVYYRPAWLKAVRRATLMFRGSYNDHEFSANNRNFRESGVMVGLRTEL